MATVGEPTMTRSDLDPITLRALDSFRRRRGVLLLLRSLGVGLLVFISLTLSLATLDYLFYFSDGVRWSLSLVIYVATAMSMWWTGLAAFGKRDELEIARHVESVAPSLRENLVSAVELSDPSASNGSAYFRRLLQSRVARRMSNVDVRTLLPLSLVRRWLLSGLSVAAFCVAMMFIPSAQFGRRFARAALPGFAIERASKTKVTILEPSPASGYVAERDAVGVIALIEGAGEDDVMLHWQSADGSFGESVMTPRLDASAFQPGRRTVAAPESESESEWFDAAQRGTESLGRRFAANLSVGSVPIQYRIIAGDAITLWHELTPLPRPRVIRFEKLYRLPAYAKLDDRTADEEHGDLKALQGTTAEVTVTFDQPVEDPVIRFGVGGARSGMEPVDDSGTKFLARISIKTSGQYQIDATSVQSGLNNPFSPTNMITPVLDTPAVVRWSPETKPEQLVSSLDVLELSALAADDLPLDRVIQEVQVNEDDFQSYALPIEAPGRKIDLNWTWDLLHRLGAGSDTGKLSAGDLVKTRLVAIDRRGARSESRLIELLIAGEGFDAERHQFLEPFSEQVSRVIAWSAHCKAVAETIKEIGKSGEFDLMDPIDERWKALQKESVELINSLSQTLAATQNTASASMTELVGRSILDIETRLDGQIKRMQWLAERDEPQWENQKKKYRQEVGRDADQTAYQCERLSEFARARFSLAFSAAMYSDVTMLRDGVERLVDDMPIQRVPRYMTLIAGQIAEIDRLLAQYETLLSQRTVQHLSSEYWSRWSQRWTIQLETLLNDRASRDQVLAVLRSLREELKQKPQQVIDTGVHDTVLRWGRDLRKEMLYLSDLTRRLFDAGNMWHRATSAAQTERNAEDAIVSGLNADWGELRWQTELNRLTVRAGGQEKLNRAKAIVNLSYAADQSLFLRAVRNVTAQGFVDYKDEPADRVLDSIAGAIRVLQGTSDIAAAKSDWLSIREGERQDDGAPLRKIYHPVWFPLQDIRIELAVRYLRQSNLDWAKFLEPIDQTRYNQDHQLASSRLDSRRWRIDPFQSVASPLESLASQLQIGLAGLAEKQEEARDVLRRYVLKLSEQAREAAETAKEAQRETDRRTDSSEASAEQVRPKQEDAIEKATETIGALVDQANTTDIVNDEQREVARDADAAAELIAEAVEETKQAIEDAQSATSAEQRDAALEAAEEKLDELSARLEQAADHFEKVENGDELAESRQQLREAEQQLQAAELLENRYQQADEMAETAKQDPRELLRQLEEELARNEPMQNALSDIAAELVEEVAKNLEQAAEDEDDLQRQLEANDQAFTEQKRQQQMLLDEFVERARTLRERTLATTSQAAGWANEAAARDEIEQVRQKMTEAISAAKPVAAGSPTLNEIQSVTRELAEQLKQSADAIEQLAEQLAEPSEQNLHGDESKRQAAANSMQQAENRLRNEELRSLDRQRKKWSSNERSAGQRIRAAEQKQRQADTALKREREKLKKDPDNEWLKREIEKQIDRRDEASRTVDQARKTKDLAVERRKQADERANELNRSKVEPLEKPNPAAELGKKLAQQAAQRMEELSKELAQVNDQPEIASDLRARAESAENLAEQQRSVENNVQTAAEDLARAARHEARLENSAMADKLATASQETEAKAAQSAVKAGEALEQTVDASENSAEAGKALQNASEQIAAQAEAVASMLGQSQSPGETPSESPQPSGSAEPSQSSQSASADATQSPSQSPGQSPSGQSPSGQQPPNSGQPAADPSAGNQASSQQMAQTLDELDRSLAAQANGQPPGQPQSGQTSQNQPGQASSQQPPQQQANGQPGQGQLGQGQLGQGQPPPNAVEVSPTLAEMLEAQLQQAARERMQRLQEAQGGEQPGEPSPSDATSPNPVSESGEGEPSDGPENVDLLRDAFVDGDWGDLRSRGVDDAAQGRSVRIPPGYSREIQAYFKALSKRAAEANR